MNTQSAAARELNERLAATMLSIGIARAAVADGSPADLDGIEGQVADACTHVRALGCGADPSIVGRLKLLRSELSALEQDIQEAIAPMPIQEGQRIFAAG
jgi:hypothetical protein